MFWSLLWDLQKTYRHSCDGNILCTMKTVTQKPQMQYNVLIHVERSHCQTHIKFIHVTLLHHYPSIISLARVPDGGRVIFEAKTLSFCSLTFVRVSIPPGWFLLLSHLCLHLHLFSQSFLSSLFVEALTRMRREPFKISGDASRYLSPALGIDLSGQFVPQVGKTLMRSSTAKF